ncbi:MAG: PAS domain-containing protein [Acidimicrobiia bacterium]
MTESAAPSGTSGSISAPHDDDLAEARAAAHAAEVGEQRQSALADIGRAALQGTTTPDLFEHAVDRLRVLLDVDAVVVLQLVHTRDELVVRSARPTEMVSAVVSAAGPAFEAQTLRADGPMTWVAASDQAGSGLGWSTPPESALATVIRGPERNFGVITVYSGRKRVFTDDEVLYLRTVANVLGSASAREQTESELRERDLQTRLAFTAARMGSWYWDPSDGTVVWSAELEALYGMERGAFPGTFDAYTETLHPEDRARVAEVIAAARRTGEEFVVEHRVVRASDGAVRWIEGRGGPVRGEDGTVRRWIGIAIDITDRVEHEHELRHREVQSRLAFAAGRMGSWTWDGGARRGTWSEELEQLVGWEPGTYDGRWESFVAPILPEDHEVLRRAVTSAATRDGEFTARYRIRHADGTIRWMETRGRRMTEQEWLGVTIDVTEPMAAEEERRRSEAVLRTTYDTAPVGLAFFDLDLRFHWVNDHLARVHGLPAAAHIGRRVSEVLPEIGGTIEAWLEQVVRDGRPVLDAEVRGPTPADPGRHRTYDDSLYPVRDDSGNLLGVGLVVVETTARREEERALLEANDQLEETVARLDALLENGPFGFAFADPELRIVGLNGAYAEMTGLDLAAHLGRRIDELGPQLAPVLERAAREVLESGHPAPDVEVTGAPGDPGGERFWLVSHYPVLGSRGVNGVGSLAVDITERRRRERTARLVAAASELLNRAVGDENALQQCTAVAVPEFADSCALYVLSRAGLARRFALTHADPTIAPLLVESDQRWPVDIERIRDAIDEPEGLLIPHVSPEDRRAFTSGADEEIAIAERHAALSVIAVPLTVGRRELGLVVFSYTELSGRHYRPDDRTLARELADRFAQVIENAYLAREAERARARLDMLAAVSDLLTVDLDSQARLEAIVDVVLPIFADTSAVYLPVGDDAVELAAFATTDRGARREFEALDVRPRHALTSDAPPAQVMRTGRSLLYRQVDPELLDTLGPPGYLDRLRAAGDIRSLVVVPLPSADGPIGVAGFGLRGGARAYEEEDLLLAEEIARRVAPAVENAFRFERQTATAEELQRMLLPERLANVAHVNLAARYIPGSVDVRVGGDWYDAVELPGGSILVAIGDVVGHGVGAATWMGKLRSVVQFCALDGLAPAETLRRLNDYCRLLPGSDMATAMIGVYDPERHSLRFASAGHPPAVIREADGTVRPVWEGRGPPLCAMDHPTFEEAEVPVGPGAPRVLYTDGLLERRDESLDTGIDRLCSALDADVPDLESLADCITHTLLEARAPADDVALLLLQPSPGADELELELPARPRELVGLRRAARHWLRRLGVGDDRIAEVLVALNELAANVIEHAYGPGDESFEVRGTRSGDRIEIEVVDRGRWRERPAGPRDRGRGLRLVKSLTDEVRIDRGSDGTTARVTIRLGNG